MPKETDQDFVETVIKAIVDHPGDVKTERVIDEMGVLITLKVHPEDMGQVIGRQGSTAKSLRTLLRVVGAKHNARVNLKIVEPEERAPSKTAEAGKETSKKNNEAGSDTGSGIRFQQKDTLLF